MDLSRDETVRRLLQNMQAHATLPHTTVRGHNGGGFSPRERERRDSVLRRRRYASADLPAAHMTAGRANRFRQQPPPHPPAPINVRHTHIKSKTHRERLLRTLGGVRGRQRSLGSAGLLCPTTPPAHQIFPPRSARKQSRLLRCFAGGITSSSPCHPRRPPLVPRSWLQWRPASPQPPPPSTHITRFKRALGPAVQRARKRRAAAGPGRRGPSREPSRPSPSPPASQSASWPASPCAPDPSPRARERASPPNENSRGKLHPRPRPTRSTKLHATWIPPQHPQRPNRPPTPKPTPVSSTVPPPPPHRPRAS